MRLRLHFALATLSALALSCAAVDQRAAVTPQRPTLSSSTSTTSMGTLEIESGGVWDPNDRFSLPLTAKWGLSPTTEVFVGWSPAEYLVRDGEDGSGIGDSYLGMRHRFIEAAKGAPSWAFQLSTKLPSGDETEGLSSGEIDTFGALIASQSFEQFNGTAFYQLGLLGEPGGPGTDFEHSLAVAADTQVAERWSVFGELATQLVPERDHEPVFVTLGTSYTRRKDSVFDVAVSFGLNDDAPGFTILFGHVGNLGRPWTGQ